MSLLDWLRQGDPAIGWQVMRDLSDEPEPVVAKERSRVASEGWGAQLLALQGEDGQWGGGPYSPKWTSTTYTLLLLRHLGIDPADPQMHEATRKVSEGVMMTKTKAFFEYSGETCITGMVLALASYFQAADGQRQIDWLLNQQRRDGGWNCDNSSARSSFHTTISALEGILEYEHHLPSSDGGLADARARGHEYLLERKLLRSLSTGELVNRRWTLFSFPPRWHYDVLRGLDYLRSAGVEPDDRCQEAIDLVQSKRDKKGRWPLQNHHRGQEHFPMEPGPGKASRWNTLRALRVLRWYQDA